MITFPRFVVPREQLLLQEKIEKIKPFLFDILKNSIVEYLEMHDPERFVGEWRRNCCQQTSILTAALLHELLVETRAGYREIQSWHGEFSDIFNGRPAQYNHAWNFCVHNDPDQNLFIDLGRNHKELLCVFTRFNQYPDHPDYVDMELLSRQQIDVLECLNVNEYFTEKPYPLVLKELKRYMSFQEIAHLCN